MNKTKKFLLKSIYLFPIGFLIWFLSSGFEIDDIGISIISGVIFSLLVIFWNLFEYEKFNGIIDNDFLESKHFKSLENNSENWNRIKSQLKMQVMDFRKIRETDSFVEYEISQKLSNSILRVEKGNELILLKIKRKYLNFIPDMAKNYKIINKLVKE
jgi:hypothetical protein